MSLSAPPRCSLFVPVPGSEQLALVKRELHFLVLFQWSKSIYHRFLPLFTYMPLTSSTPPLFFFSFPSTLSYLRGISLYLQLNMSHRAQGEAWHSLSTVQSISKQAFSLRLFTAALYMPANNNTLPYWQCKRIRLICGANKGPLTVEQGPKFIIGWVINSILWIASQCPHPGTIDDIQPTWLNPISKADGWSWAHLPCNHVIAVWVNQTWIKRFVCSSWQTELRGWNNAACWKWPSSTRNYCRYFFDTTACNTWGRGKKSIFTDIFFHLYYSTSLLSGLV